METKDSQALLQEAQTVEQALHTYTAQRSTLQQQLSETENAISELASAQDAYRIIGNVMVKVAPDKLRAELEEKKQSLTTRIAAVDRQEKRLREQLEGLQQKLLKG